MGRLKYPYRLGSRFPARRPGHYTLDPSLVLGIPFLEGSGSKVEDHSVHKNTGTIVNATWKAQGIRGPCLDFDGTGDYVNVSDAVSLDVGNAITLEAWIKPKAAHTANQKVTCRRGTGDSGYIYTLSYDEANHMRFLKISEGADFVTVSPGVITSDVWTYITGTFNGLIGRLYLNGIEVDTRTVTTTFPASDQPYTIGGRAAAQFFAGLIDQVRILNRALSAQEILDRYERSKP